MSFFLSSLHPPDPPVALSQNLASDLTGNLTSLTIRAFQEQDLRKLATLLTDCFHSGHNARRWLRPIFEMGAYEDLKGRWQHPSSHYLCLVAELLPDPPVDSRPNSHTDYIKHPSYLHQQSPLLSSPAIPTIVGMVEMTQRSTPFWFKSNHPYLYVSSLAVKVEYRRCGIAQRLLAQCEQTARVMGLSVLYLHVMSDNQSARRLYDRSGYQPVSQESVWPSWRLMGRLGSSKKLLLRKFL